MTRTGLLFVVPGALAAMTSVGAARAAEVDAFAGMGARMRGFVEEGEAMGIVTLVATKDRVLHEGAVGTSDGVRRMQVDDLFWIASMSKPITAVAAALLVEEGKLRWEDPVEKYVPEFGRVQRIMTMPGPGGIGSGGMAVGLNRPIGVRDLLTHTAGLADMYATSEPHWTLERFAQQAAPKIVRFDPGRNWAYSSAGFDVVGRVVEVVSGMPFDQFLQKRLFDPLGMKDTTFWPAEKEMARYAHTYERDEGTRTLKETTIPYLYGTEVTDRKRAPLGGAGLFSTAQDVAKFYQMLLNGGRAPDVAGRPGMRILKPETLAVMTKRQTECATDRPGLASGYGFWVVEDPKGMEANATLTAGSYGHGGAFGTNAWVDPARGCVYVILLERAKMEVASNSPMRIAFQKLAAEALERNR
jgi:CubicO group peptidase (beta-lactamase class C family)